MASRHTLSNGLTVVAEPLRVAPVVAFQVWVKAGSADETPDEVGLAHLHEHMLFKGTPRRGLGEIARSVEAHGGEINAWTSFDQTVYHVVMASRHAWHGLDVLADAIRNSAFDADELSREIEVVCEEIKRSLDMPGRRASKQLFASAFKAHPYGRPVIGFEANVRAHTRARVLSFFAKHYQPKNLVLSAVGDFEEAALLEKVEALFGGDWARAPLTPFLRAPEPRFEGVQVSLSHEDVKDAYLHLAFQIPGVEHEDTAALDVLAMLVGQGDASRLSLEVRRRLGLARDVNAWAWTPREAGLFAASIVAKPATALEALERTVEVLANLTRDAPGEREVETVKSLLDAEAVYQRETVQGLARKLGYYESMAGGLEREARYYASVAKVTPAALVEVAHKYLRFERCVVTGLVPPELELNAERLQRSIATAAARARATPSSPPGPQPAPPSPRTVRRPSSSPLIVEALPFGATLIVKEERAVPLVAFRAAFQGGLRTETPESNGLTTLLARTLTRGTSRVDAETISQTIDAMAGSLSAIGGRNSMSLRGEFLSKHLEPALELFFEVLAEPAFPQAEVERERALQLQDIASRDDRPSAIAFELFAKTLWQRHPYRLAMLGEKQSVERLDASALSAAHARLLTPSRMTLAVVGDVDADRIRALVLDRFGKTPPAPPAPLQPLEEPGWTGPRRATHTLARAQTHLVLGFRGLTLFDPQRRALDVLQTILSGQSGRLFLELRDKRSMAYSVSASSVEGLDDGSFSLYMGTSPEKVDAALEGMREQLDRVRQEAVTPAELDRAREHLIGTQSIGLQRNGARAGVMALDACYGLGAEAYRRYPEEIASVTAEQVRALAARIIDFDRSALALVGP